MVVTKSREERLAAFENILPHWGEAQSTFKNLPNVKDVGIGYKMVNGALVEEMAIIVYVDAPKDDIQEMLNGIPVNVQLQHNTSPLGNAEPKMIGGIRVDADIDNPGTLGCIATYMPTGDTVLLSSHHVLYGKKNSDNSKVFHPDKCCSLCCACNVVARNVDKAKGPYSDAAVARIKFDADIADSYILDNRIKGLGVYTQTGNPAVETLTNEDALVNGTSIVRWVNLAKHTIVPAIPGDRVRKVGLTTGRTIGIVTAVGGACTVNYGDNEIVQYLDQVAIQAQAPTTEFAKEGDSGALIVNDKNSAVGLLMSKQGDTYWANNIHNVMSDVKIRIYGPPKAKFRMDKAGDGKSAPLTVTFHDESEQGEGVIVSQIWNMHNPAMSLSGASTVGEGPTFNFTFVEGVYYVSLIVIDEYGLSSRVAVKLEVVKAGTPLAPNSSSLVDNAERAASFEFAEGEDLRAKTPINGEGRKVRNGSHVELLQYLQEQLLLSENGRNIATHIRSFQQEVITLVNKNRKVTVMWQRKQGPAFVAKFLKALRQSDAFIPQEVNGIRMQSLLQGMALVLEEEGSNELALVLREHSLMIFNLFDKHRTLEELLSAIHGNTVPSMIR